MRVSPDRSARPRRGGAAIVEVALCLTIFFMFLFGIFEYSRYLMMLHVATNAARDGARYGAVNVDKSNTFDTQNVTVGARVYTNVVEYTLNKMRGADKQIQNVALRVYPCEPTTIFSDPPVIQPKLPRDAAGTIIATAPGVGYYAPVPPLYTPVTRTVNWNSAVFTERIAVEVTGDYIPSVPNLLRMNSTIPVRIIVLMGSEG